ncbi:MAG: helix-turn-helix domain-containing protein [Anaerolineae bacterium]|nr:helix-turn-helix domain-containing protein [Anaerolineae bacterium]MDW8172707.1 helix-turn-helix domain-containing protein [Anaerolineae bacterium]
MTSWYDALPEQRVISDLEAMRGYLDPLRQRIVQALAPAPLTIQELAQHLGVPFTRLYYHMNFLEKYGFIHQVDSRSYGGAVEQKVYHITAKSFLLDRRLLAVLRDDEDDALEVVLQTSLDETRADIRASARQGIIDLSQPVPHPKAALLIRGFFRLSPQQAAMLQERMKALIHDMANMENQGKQQNQEDRAFYGFTLAFYPSAQMISGPVEDADASDQPA